MRLSVSKFWEGAAVGLLLQSGAEASPVTQLNVAYNTGSDFVVSIHGPVEENVYATAFQVSYVGGQAMPGGNNNPFIGFCVDIEATLKPNSYWQATPFGSIVPADEGYVTASGMFRAENLYQAFAGQVNWNNQSGGAAGGALQLAIWDVLYGTDLNRVDDAASSFYVTPASIPGYGDLATYQAMVAQANAWLATAANSPLAPLLGSTFWQTTDADGNPTTDNQDLIGPTGFVPEPATFLAGLLAGSYLVWHTIRRRG